MRKLTTTHSCFIKSIRSRPSLVDEAELCFDFANKACRPPFRALARCLLCALPFASFRISLWVVGGFEMSIACVVMTDSYFLFFGFREGPSGVFIYRRQVRHSTIRDLSLFLSSFPIPFLLDLFFSFKMLFDIEVLDVQPDIRTVPHALQDGVVKSSPIDLAGRIVPTLRCSIRWADVDGSLTAYLRAAASRK